MDWQFAIKRNRAALKRVLAMLVAMVRSGPGGTKSQRFGFSSERTPETIAEGWVGQPTLPRHLHRAVLRLLRPAEAAARRLVIIAAHKTGNAVLLSPSLHGDMPGEGVAVRETSSKLKPRRRYPLSIALPLTDPPRRPGRQPVSRAMPRISVPGWNTPAPLPRPPAPGDAIDARRLTLRLAALGRALDDLPREARRFARWQASRDAARTQDRNHAKGTQARHRTRRVWPLRLGRPPGQLSPRNRRSAQDVHRILGDLNNLAVWVLEPPDTS